MPSLAFSIFLVVLLGLGAGGAIVGLTAVLGNLRPLEWEVPESGEEP